MRQNGESGPFFAFWAVSAKMWFFLTLLQFERLAPQRGVCRNAPALFADFPSERYRPPPFPDFVPEFERVRQKHCLRPHCLRRACWYVEAHRQMRNEYVRFALRHGLLCIVGVPRVEDSRSPRGVAAVYFVRQDKFFKALVVVAAFCNYCRVPEFEAPAPAE